jgi:hypothetical protein
MFGHLGHCLSSASVLLLPKAPHHIHDDTHAPQSSASWQYTSTTATPFTHKNYITLHTSTPDHCFHQVSHDATDGMVTHPLMAVTMCHTVYTFLFLDEIHAQLMLINVRHEITSDLFNFFTHSITLYSL